MALANLIRVQRATSRAHERTNARAFLAASQTTNCGAAERSAGDRQFVTMLLPE